MRSKIRRLAIEPPFRLFVRGMLRFLPVSIHTRATWCISKRPHYLIGLIAAAEQAKLLGVDSISAIEFGVAGGNGLLALQEEAKAVESNMGIRVQVYGFDMGASGLPDFIGDYRDHPDGWQPGDYAMDEAALRAKLDERTTLILGNVSETVDAFFEEYDPPKIGFAAFDLDLYSSTRDALKVLRPGRTLLNTPLYFDDIEFIFNHRFAGEFLAIDEFNAENEMMKIDQWHGISRSQPFGEHMIYKKLYVAHDLEAISNFSLTREQSRLDLSK